MTGQDLPTILFRIEPETNTRRFYAITVQPNLFGGYSVIRNWGRIGTGGQIIMDFHDSENEAMTAHDRILKAKERRGYRHSVMCV